MLLIGYTKKPHGLKGEIKLDVDDKYLDALLESEVLVLKIKGKDTPFFVEDIRIGNAIIAKFEDVNTPEEALSIASKEIYIKEELISEEVIAAINDPEDPENWTGYTVIDLTYGPLGVIDSVQEYPQQFMGMVEYQKKQVLIPLHPNLIVQLDNENKILKVDLPEGLLEL